jgi:hypothetical protein
MRPSPRNFLSQHDVNRSEAPMLLAVANPLFLLLNNVVFGALAIPTGACF